MILLTFAVVWNIKSQEQRFVDLTPSDDWGGAGLLGVTIRLDNYGGADERVIRVLEVEPNSPASIAGLVPMNDYMLGTNVVAFETTETLAAVLHQHVNQIVELYVYNSESDVVRVTPLMPTLTWGGHGMLGAEVGTGYLHRLPSTSRDTHGSSVERKVRWVGNADEKNGEGGNSIDNADSAERNSASIGGAAPANDTPLELEPHLEMEVEHGEDRKPEDVSKQPHQLGEVEDTTPSSSHQQQSQPSSETAQPPGDSSSKPAESSGGEPTKAPSQSTQPVVNDEKESEPTNEQQSNEAAAAAAMAAAAEIASPSVVRDTNGALPAFPAALPPLPPPPQVSPSPRQSPTKVDAEALFSAPPPPIAGASPGAMLPPPPKMSS